MSGKEMFLKIDSLSDEYIKIWEDVSNIESPSSFKEGIDRCGEYFAHLARQKGFEVDCSRQEVSGDAICITMNKDAKGVPVVFSGHIDTVHAVGSFGSPATKIADGKIYGPGVCDCKGGVVASLMAMDVLAQAGFTDRPVKLIIQSDEEVGSSYSKKSTVKYMCDNAKDAAVFVNLEPYNNGFATMSRKGIIGFNFEVTGIEGHSSKCATVGANAIIDAAHKMMELDKIKDNDGITCNVAKVQGGTLRNIIPGKCTFETDFRFMTNEQFEYICKFVKELAATVHVEGCKCTVNEPGSPRPAMELTDFNVKAFERMNQVFEKNGLPKLKMFRGLGGSDAAYTTQEGIPTIDSLGVEGGFIHSADEYALLSSLAECAKRLVAIALDY